MLGKYAYSLTGVSWIGAAETRDQAASQAVAVARGEAIPPTTVYVGKMVAPDAKAGGHARGVLANMGARAREEFGDAATGYMRDLPKVAVEELDGELAAVVDLWIGRHRLSPTFFKVEAISEHLVPGTPRFREGPQASEVHEQGAERDESGSGFRV